MILPLTVALLFFAESYAARFVCYYGSWSIYRHGPGKFRVEDIDPNLCTHLVYTFGGIDEQGKVKALDAWNDIGDEWHEGAFTKLQKLRKINPNLKIMFAVGGWNEGSEKYSRVMGDTKLRNNFINSALNFTREYSFDGFDLDWEYPALRGGKPHDKDSFSLLVKELASVFKPYNLILSAAVSANALNITNSYDCPIISKYLDFINVMTYDLHGSWEKVTGHHTALFPHPSDKPSDIHLNIKAAIDTWLSCGASPSKLNLGVASYGRSFTLADATKTTIGSPVTGPGPAGKFVPESGFLGFHEICYEQKNNLWKKFYDPTQEVPYAVKGNVWVGYDDPASIVKKVEFAKQFGLGGMMVWSVETDDFNGTCGLGKNPLLNAVKNALQKFLGDTPQTTIQHSTKIIPHTTKTTKQDSTKTVPSSTMPSIPGNYDHMCNFLGKFFRHPQDYSKFFRCAHNESGGLKALPFICPAGFIFDETIQTCNYKRKNYPY